MSPSPREIALPGGRILQVWVEGAEDGDVFVWHHGTPGSGLPFGPRIELARERGLRFVSYSRPGYGGSTRREGRSVADCAADVAGIADALGVQRFFTGGGSGGGPHALACAAMLPDRVRAAVSVAGAVPYEAEGVDFLEGMSRENLVEFGAAAGGPASLTAWMDEHAEATAGAQSAEALIEAMGELVSDVDRAALTGEYGGYLVEEEHVALGNGYWGWFDDDLAFVRDWGFDPTTISVPVSVWQGRQDQFVPFTHGEWLASRIPGARPHLLEEHGHISLGLASFGEILDDLLEAGRDRPGLD